MARRDMSIRSKGTTPCWTGSSGWRKQQRKQPDFALTRDFGLTHERRHLLISDSASGQTPAAGIVADQSRPENFLRPLRMRGHQPGREDRQPEPWPQAHAVGAALPDRRRFR